VLSVLNWQWRCFRASFKPCRTRGPAAPEIKFASDSPLEGSGFEPSVPLPRLSSIRAVRAEIIGRSTDVFRRDREFDVSALQDRWNLASTTFPDAGPGRPLRSGRCRLSGNRFNPRPRRDRAEHWVTSSAPTMAWGRSKKSGDVSPPCAGARVETTTSASWANGRKGWFAGLRDRCGCRCACAHSGRSHLTTRP
jgi:hypothetical protein